MSYSVYHHIINSYISTQKVGILGCGSTVAGAIDKCEHECSYKKKVMHICFLNNYCIPIPLILCITNN